MVDKAIIDKLAILIPMDIAEAVANRLESLGYILTETDNFCVSFSYEKATNHIKVSCNITEIPEQLYNIYIDMICGEFLNAKFNSNQLDADNFNLETAISSVSMGDASVNFDNASNSNAKITNLIKTLLDGKGDLVCFRKLRW